MAQAGATARADEPSKFSSTVRNGATPEDAPEERDTTTVTQRDMDRRLSSSTPDALRYEAGVFVQQTAHGQASVYVRGLTGQQLSLNFDGIRMNNSVYRQGPNQYLFTVDQATLASIEVLRGGGSTRWGSDALGGAVLAHPIEPPRPTDGLIVQPWLLANTATADSRLGGRAQIGIGWQSDSGLYVGFIGGVGARQAGMLEGRAVENPNPNTPKGRLPWVPAYAPDGRTQLGTGYKDLTADARLVLQLRPSLRMTAAFYMFREYDAPRTDNCPAPTAPYDDCLVYEQQFRHTAYVAWEGRHGPLLEHARLALSWQQQHERRRLDTPRRFTTLIGEDDIDTGGIVFNARSATWRPAESIGLSLVYGADTYHDWVRSHALTRYTDVKIDSPQSRGQYIEGSTYLQGGAFVDLEARLPARFTVRGGARVAWVSAHALPDAESGTLPVDRSWVPLVGHAGVEWRALDQLHLLVNYDNSFRVPNLDDLTSRQLTGPGFQFENAGLLPERAHTLEAGVRVRASWIEADLWAFDTLIQDAVVKQSRTYDECPPKLAQCQGAWSRFQLVNAPSLSEVRGFEGTVRASLPWWLRLRATLAYALGEGPRLGVLPADIMVTRGDRVPLSRIPPLNGTVELWMQHPSGFSLGGSLRWAAAQERLADQDFFDGRIPLYGTPGFAVLDLRAAYAIGTRALMTLVFENVLDSPYRYHGSSINGAGRGVILSMRVRLD